MAKNKQTQATDTADDTLVQLATRVPKSLHRRLKQACVSADRSIGDAVAEGLEHVVSVMTGKGAGRKAARA